MADEILILETRKEIYNVIVRFPGLHLREISRRLNMPASLAEYHLQELEDNNVVISIRESGYKRYYPHPNIAERDERITELQPKERKILGILRQKIPLKITLFLLETKHATHSEISESLGISPSKLSYHLNKLVQLALVNHQRRGEGKGYSLTNEKKIKKLLETHRPPKDLVEGFIDLWEKLNI